MDTQNPFTDEERLVRVAPGPARDELVPLIAVAEGSPTQIASYYQQGDLFVLRGADGPVRGLALTLPASDGAIELKAVAVAPAAQGRGVGRRMLGQVLTALEATGVRRVVVGTAACNIGALAFYQKLGFRLWKIERDFFNAARGYPDGITDHGIPLRDMVWLDRSL